MLICDHQLLTASTEVIWQVPFFSSFLPIVLLHSTICTQRPIKYLSLHLKKYCMHTINRQFTVTGELDWITSVLTMLTSQWGWAWMILQEYWETYPRKAKLAFRIYHQEYKALVQTYIILCKPKVKLESSKKSEVKDTCDFHCLY